MNAARPRGGSGSVRIIGGTWRGTRLQVPQSPGLRPTSDRVRETLFNWLQPVLPGARVLDLFAGSGALGLEAVSRGATHAHLVESDPLLAQALRAAAQRLQAGAKVSVECSAALDFLRQSRAPVFDIAFVDPPFEAGPWPAILDALPPRLAPAAWLYLESPRGQVPAISSEWAVHREGATREVRFALYRRVTLPAMHTSGSPAAT